MPAGINFPRPLDVGKPSPKITGSPGSPTSWHGYVTAPSSSKRSQVIPAIEGIHPRISSKIDRGPV